MTTTGQKFVERVKSLAPWGQNYCYPELAEMGREIDQAIAAAVAREREACAVIAGTGGQVAAGEPNVYTERLRVAGAIRARGRQVGPEERPVAAPLTEAQIREMVRREFATFIKDHNFIADLTKEQGVGPDVITGPVS